MADPALLRAEDVEFSYGDQFSLHVPEFIIPERSVIGFVGPNGSGKSTFLRVLAFLVKPHKGSIFFSDDAVSFDNDEITRHVTFLPQDPYLLKRSVFENVAYGLRVRHDHKNLGERVRGVLRQVGLSPDLFAERQWHELSGGEAQRVALASRLILRPKLLILDEPTANVDRESALLIKDAIVLLRREYDTALVIASHDILWLSGVAERIDKMVQGRIAGYVSENVLPGPWSRKSGELWSRMLPDGQVVRATAPPSENASALLSPRDIILSLKDPEGLSARNALRGHVTAIAMEETRESLTVTATVSNLSLHCRLTVQAVRELGILPGSSVFVIFKATSLRWNERDSS
ncbi:MAG: ATP-binding cassette domain-containing protein [Deltaproteobacteria bacterium]|nr:ATP-binding cassette domain-containing protein [Deltaproteobacteria bacterium]